MGENREVRVGIRSKKSRGWTGSLPGGQKCGATEQIRVE